MKNNLEETFASEAMPHLKDLYRTALRLTREPSVAEDIVQEVFLQAWKSFAGYEAGTNCRAWLYKILFFKISHHRRALVMQSRFFQSDDEKARFSRAPLPDADSAKLTDDEIIAAVGQSFRQLPQRRSAR
jgi:RNA polymerase sigma-70 factor (ECF subfamily)